MPVKQHVIEWAGWEGNGTMLPLANESSSDSGASRHCSRTGAEKEGAEHVQGVPSAWLLAGVGRLGLGVWVGRS